MSARSETEPQTVAASHAERSTLAVAAGTRAGGLVLALGYLTGLADGPLVAAVAGVALITFGRSLRMDRVDQALAAAGLAVIAGALGITALRWGSLELAELRSVQAVLGPTILVGPEMTAVAVIVAAVAATLALTVWVAVLPMRGFGAWAWTGLETLVMALALVTAFWGPKVLLGTDEVPRTEIVESLAGWAAASAAVIAVGIGGGLLARLVVTPVRVAVMGVAALALLVAVGLIAGTL
ncbi:MAG: hypothetical protein M3360_04400 [Actinomycetota bacterium]|nr:hypothetical protein [Actinomycetota bacterium]